MKVDAVLCGDIHLSDKKPLARTDDYFSAMWEKFIFIDSLGLEYDCPILCSGDFFDNWKPSPELISSTIEAMNADWYTVYGDHDLASHSLKLKHKSGLTTLAKAGKIKIVKGGHGSDKSSSKLPKKIKPIIIGNRKLMLWHVLTWDKELPYPGCETNNAKQLLKKYKEYDCIVTGDNHKPFIKKYKDRMLVNVGSMMRSKADQINHKPTVWLYTAKTNSVTPVYLPIEKNVISREHIEIKNQRDERIEAFISGLGTDFKLTMSFKQNLINFFSVNKTKKKIKEIILNHMEDLN